MKKKSTEEQIIRLLSRQKNGEKVLDLGREFGITPATIYTRKKKFSNMTVNETKRLRELESENGKLKRIVAEQALDIVMLKDVNSKSGRAQLPEKFRCVFESQIFGERSPHCECLGPESINDDVQAAQISRRGS